MSNRRELVFSSLDEVLSDVKKLDEGQVRYSGKNDFPNIVRHLAITNDLVVGELIPPKLPFVMRMMMPFMRSSILNGPVKPGFKLPSDMQTFFWPEESIETEAAIQRLSDSIDRYKSKGPLPVHPLFGKATRQQVDGLILKHAAMHLSFVHPDS